MTSDLGLNTAFHGGYRDAEDSYQRVSPGPRLGSIDRPTLILAAADDPFIPEASMRNARKPRAISGQRARSWASSKTSSQPGPEQAAREAAFPVTRESASGRACPATLVREVKPPAHLPERDWLLLSALLDHLPEGRAGLVDDVLPVLALDSDQDQRRPSVARNDHAFLLGRLDALSDLFLKVAHVD